MSMDPQTLQMLLAQRLGGQQPGGATPQQTAPVGPMNAASQIAQRLMLMRALQQRPPGTPQPTPQTPGAGVQLGWSQGNGLPQP